MITNYRKIIFRFISFKHENANNQEFYVKPAQGLGEGSAKCINSATAVVAVQKSINKNPESSIG